MNKDLKISGTIEKIGKYEAYYFYAFLLINLLPVLLFRYFATVDGPAHLYNANLIVEMLKNPGSRLDQFLVFNPNLNPNWTGHLILSGLLFVFPAWLSEKILVAAFLLFFPISFRFFFHSIGLRKNFLLYFIFPFTYSFLFQYGFYNFHLGLIFLFLSMGLWSTCKQQGFSAKGIIYLLGLSTLMCFSHLFVFAVWLLILAILNMNNIIDIFDRSKQANVLKEIWQQLLFLLPGLVIAMLYFISNSGSETQYSFPALKSLFNLILQVQPIKAMNYGKESIYAPWVFYSLLAFTLSAFIYKLKSKERLFTLKSSTWGILTLIFLISLFTMPDSINAAIGFISSRLVFFFFLFLIVWLAHKKSPLWLKIAAFIIINYVNIALIRVYVKATGETNQLVLEISKASKKVEPYSTVLPFENFHDWRYTNVSNYLGVDKPMIILHNYEASLGHFPLRWNYMEIPKLQFGNLTSTENCQDWPTSNTNKSETIEYVLFINVEEKGNIETCKQEIDPQLQEFYSPEYSSKDKRVELYRLKTVHQ